MNWVSPKFKFFSADFVDIKKIRPKKVYRHTFD